MPAWASCSVIWSRRASSSAWSRPAGTSKSTFSTRSSSTLSRAALIWSTFAICSTALVRSARISSAVSNSDTIWANSSSTSGSVSVCTF